MLRPIRETYAGQRYDDLLVGLDVADDAAVYRVSDDLAIVVTLDFFTPIVDNPYAYGAIAAANSLSDIYAMGARPLLALNVAAMPKKLPLDIAAEIIRGGAEKAREAGIPVAGGHTVQDDEPKYGLVALGAIHPEALTRKGGAEPGQHLLLSKPLGAGVVTTGLKQDKATDEEVAIATASMMRLNDRAARIAHEFAASAVTDITGFGLLGHSWEMAKSGEVGFRFHFDDLPYLPGAKRLGASWTYPGGAYDNRSYFSPHVRFDPSFEEWQQVLCFSPETSGGLLIALPAENSAAAIAAAKAEGLDLRRVGEVTAGPDIEVVK
ncbi:MAG: selenide, water dikinase SelD [Caldilineales bacterium]|nr:selenide, water dikinase SelD [Caldilineales bacterium]